MADKIVKAFEALRSHYLQESTQAVNLAQKSVAVAEGNETTSSPNPKYIVFYCFIIDLTLIDICRPKNDLFYLRNER